jgi:hypothetical protein
LSAGAETQPSARSLNQRGISLALMPHAVAVGDVAGCPKSDQHGNRGYHYTQRMDPFMGNAVHNRR